MKTSEQRAVPSRLFSCQKNKLFLLCNASGLTKGIFLLIVGSMCIWLNVSVAQARQKPDPSIKFVEVEVILSDQCSLSDIRALPRAPGSDLEVLDSGMRVRVQLPARRVKAIVKKGADVTVLRKFVLVEGSTGEAGSLDGAATLGTCSGPYQYDENGANVFIPDTYPAEWAYSDIYISGAPVGATVTCIDVHYEIIHDYVGDLIVDLTDQDLTYEYNLWEDPYASWENLKETVTGITAFNGEMVNQIWTLWAVDTFPFWYEGYIDYWWIKVYYKGVPAPPNDDCGDAIAVEDGVPYVGSTVGATGFEESGCSYNDTADVWHSYTPASAGLVTISLSGSTFDTTLAVFDVCGGRELTCNDDWCDELQSEITMNMAGASTYLIRVAGYDGATGDYTLTVTSHPCILPPEPNSPHPASGVGNVPLETILSWNSSKMYRAGSSKAATLPPKDTSMQKVIYGSDDRLDEYQVKDTDVLAAGDSTVALVNQYELVDNGDGTLSLPTETYAQWYQWADPIETGNPLCPDEPFRDQPSPAWCSGFLVAPDIIATTGHCVCPGDCADMAVVFGFVMLDADTPVLTIDESEVYYCSEVIARQIGDPEWALVRLDREVTGHNPLTVRAGGVIPDDEPLLVIGHPLGLPRKYDSGATVRDNSASAYFQANLDTYAGSSGSAVLNANTLEVEGIIYSGNPDFVEDGSCDRSNVCPDSGCPEWEDVTRATEFSSLLPWQRYDVYFDVNSPPTELICSDIDEAMCDPTGEPTATLRPCTTYYWQVVSRNSCSQTEGPIWSFTTASVSADFDRDCDVDFGDLASLVSHWLEDEPSVNIAAPDNLIDFSDFAVLAEHWLWQAQTK